VSDRDDTMREAVEAAADKLGGWVIGHDCTPDYLHLVASSLLEASGLPARLAAVEAELDGVRRSYMRQCGAEQVRAESAERRLADRERALAEAEPIIAHLAGLVVQDVDGYSQIHLALIEDARAVLAQLREGRDDG
jgi:hypothetical protein